jgi:hypothetical protein
MSNIEVINSQEPAVLWGLLRKFSTEVFYGDLRYDNLLIFLLSKITYCVLFNITSELVPHGPVGQLFA